MSDANRDVADIDLPDLDGRTSRIDAVSSRTWGFLVTTLLVVAAFAYDYAIVEGGDPTVDLTVENPVWTVVVNWNLALHEWLFVLSLVVFSFYVAVPLATNRAMTRRYWRRLKTRPVGLASFLVLGVLFLAGMVGPGLLGAPRPGMHFYQPPWGLTVKGVSSCVGTLVETGNSGGGDLAAAANPDICWGSLQYPLGTDGNGRNVLTIVVNALRISIEVGMISAMILVPIATLVGTVAATYGGWVDDVLMRFVDLQQVIPAFFVYIVAQFVFRPKLTLMLVIFGVLSWGSIARVVRSEAISKREAEYVNAARSAGASWLWIVRRHIVPNVTNTVISSVTLLIPTLILIEAALSFLGFGDPAVASMGQAITNSLNDMEFPRYWWVSTAPLVALTLLIVSLNLFGDVLRDVLDPRMER